ncbi:RDD family protein [Natronoglycomyces albus]|uniref:RDD family protein n=1 Tax=Natronoglycomyces albus TaxID=2811108 RepID=A0A895XLS4_9ACTN|nr:RDD family protein [Natronoglycomyces albus]QSB06294.1 RDD family protein [Natronoglycomyces albus]
MSAQSKSSSSSYTPASPDLASLGERFAALLIDWVACLVIVRAAGVAGWLPEEWAYLYTPGLLVVVYTAALGFSTQSLGMFFLRIHCVNADHLGSIGVPRALVRVLLMLLVFPLVTAFIDPHGRGLHDRAANSVMVKGASRG